ncbi:Senescence regulator S40 [Spatholobus suberectus]|nr:Senescence regulator S40 [Spatholobus suberectus]
MAKGRKFGTTLRSERFLGTTYTQGSPAADPSEFREEDVWSMAEDRDADVSASPDEWESRAPRRRRNREQGHRHVGGLSLAFEDPGSNGSGTRIVHHQYRAHDAVSSPRGHQMATSAPVNVPDWSKILRVDSVESLHEMDGDENESEMVPPHEYLARSRKMAANSVFEGVGRTLKGRDMRRVRDAVWSQTGFDG